MNWKLILSYNGSAFHGWQVQPGLPTVQGTLAAALHRLTGESVLPQGSGRTDTGVHALAQVASFALSAPIPPANLVSALNRTLPPSIRILSAELAPATFHARHSALRKTYQYRIFEQKNSKAPPQADARICTPFLAPLVWDCRFRLALVPMQQAATLLLGTHDFTSFAASDPEKGRSPHPPDGPNIPRPIPWVPHPHDGPIVVRVGIDGDSHQPLPPISRRATAPNPTKTLFHSTLHREDNLLLYTVTGSGFLHHMVRNLVGTLVEVGRGALPPSAITTILAARNRSAAGPTAPPQGLFLVSVDYPEQ